MKPVDLSAKLWFLGVGKEYVAKIEPDASGFLVTIAPALSGEQRLVSRFDVYCNTRFENIALLNPT